MRRFYYVVRCPTTGYVSSRYTTREEATRKIASIAQAGTCQHAHTIEEEEVD